MELFLFEEKGSPNEYLIHIGTPHDGPIPHSGRWPYGSGDNAYQHAKDWITRVKRLRSENFVFVDSDGKKYTGDVAIAKSMGLTTTQFRIQEQLSNHEIKATNIAKARSLSEKGMGATAIGRELGVSEATVRGWLTSDVESNIAKAKNTADFLRKQIDEKGIIDIGKGSASKLNISEDRLKEAVAILEMEGYVVRTGAIPQVTNKNQQTINKVIGPPGSPNNIAYQFGKINYLGDEYVTKDDGEHYDTYEYPASMDSKRLQIVYAEDGGTKRDGLIELRRGVPDLDLGGSHYAQVRILVDDDYYLKGMAVYGDNMPEGIDVRFNTNKHKGTPMEKVLKSTAENLAKDPTNPFGALIKEEGGQSHYYDKDGNRKLSLINKKSDEGDWDQWKDSLPAQFLSKQPLELIKRQLHEDVVNKRSEYEEIMSISNPEVKKYLLSSFADDCDKAASTLRGAALPGQTYQVMLPVPSLSDKEIYAPNFKDGTQLALIRYPHAGLFEIPIVTVNNKNREARKMLGDNLSTDVVCVNPTVAQQLSGADFDGDTVMCIPQSNRVKVAHRQPFQELLDFDPKEQYPYREGMKVMQNTNREMGVISNLITDMTLAGASDDELVRAVKHSMVVIDAKKHKLDYVQSEKDNNIQELKELYQRQYNPVTGEIERVGGAATLISRAKSPAYVDKQKGSTHIDPETGDLVGTGRLDVWTDYKTGEVHTRQVEVPRMNTVKDARELMSNPNNPNPKEVAYADYANDMKDLAREARLSILSAGNQTYSPDAHKQYREEVESLEEKLNTARSNAVAERHAQDIANAYIRARKEANPGLKKDRKTLGKIQQRAIKTARDTTGAKRTLIQVTPKEWEAIEAGAISKSRLNNILAKTDIDTIRSYATPRYEYGALPEYKVNKIRNLAAMGKTYTQAQIAEAVGCSVSTVQKYLNEGG